MLAFAIYLSFAGALAQALLPKGRATLSRWLALAVAVAGLAVAVAGFVSGMGQGRVTFVDLPWVPSMGIHFLLAADGISRVLVLLTGLAAVAGVLFSWNIELRTNEFFAFFLALIGGVYGVFLSFDLFLLFVFYEIAIVPKYFLIAIWGSTRREYAAMKLAIYSFAGSAMVFIGLLAAYATAGSHSTTLDALAHAGLPASFQMWCFPLVFVGFAILAGMWPFHTWAPTGHVAAPTAASMLLAGVVMKLGAEGCIVSDGTRRRHVPAHRVTPVDATGAGDCFDGAFATRLLAGDDPFTAAAYANVAAALATTGYGAVAPLPRDGDVRALLRKAAA